MRRRRIADFRPGGVPLKLVEAMALGKAIVANREIVEGMEVSEGRDLLIRGEVREFADAVVRVLTDPQLNRDLGNNARETFVRTLSRSRAEENLRRGSVLSQEGGRRARKEARA